MDRKDPRTALWKQVSVSSVVDWTQVRSLWPYAKKDPRTMLWKQESICIVGVWRQLRSRLLWNAYVDADERTGEATLRRSVVPDQDCSAEAIGGS